MKINFLIIFLMLGIGKPGWCRKHSLNIKSQSTFPLSDSNWKALVGDRANSSYTVKLGDSLSKICRDQLGSVDYWPKLWEVNRESIHNPHLLEPEQKLLFCRTEKSSSRKPASENPLSKRKKDDGLTDQLLRAKLAHQHRLRYLFLEREEVLGIITGSYDQKNFLGVDSKIYIGPLNRNKLLAGKKYAIVRDANGPVIKKTNNRTFTQQLVQIIGEVEIESFGQDLARAAIVSAYDMVERGDRIMDIPAISMQDPPLTPPKNLITKVLVGDNLDEELFVTGQLVVLDKGSSAGMQLGYVFHVFDDTDPVLKGQQLIEPRSKGEIKIVHLSNYSSVGYIQKSIEGIEVGDILLSRDELANTAPSFNKSRMKVFIE